MRRMPSAGEMTALRELLGENLTETAILYALAQEGTTSPGELREKTTHDKGYIAPLRPARISESKESLRKKGVGTRPTSTLLFYFEDGELLSLYKQLFVAAEAVNARINHIAKYRAHQTEVASNKRKAHLEGKYGTL